MPLSTTNTMEAVAKTAGVSLKPSVVGNIGGALSGAGNAMFFAPMAAGVLSRIADFGWLKNISKGRISAAFNTTAGVMGLGDHPLVSDPAATKAAIESAIAKLPAKTTDAQKLAEEAKLYAAAQDLPTAIRNVLNPSSKGAGAAKTVANIAESAIGNIEKYAQRTTGGTKAWNTVKNSSATHIAYNVGLVGTEVARTAMDLGTKVKTLQAMQLELTGKKPSALAVMTGSGLDPIVQEARHELTGGKAALSTALQMGGTIGNAIMMLTNKSNGMKGFMLTMGLSMGTGMAANAITAGNTTLQSYRALVAFSVSNPENSGQQAPIELYKGIIGGMNSKASEESIMQASELAFNQKMAPKEVLQLAAQLKNGSFVKSHTSAAAPSTTADYKAPVTIGNKTFTSRAPGSSADFAANIASQNRGGMAMTPA